MPLLKYLLMPQLRTIQKSTLTEAPPGQPQAEKTLRDYEASSYAKASADESAHKSVDISGVRVIPIREKDGLVGFASLVINNAIYLGSIAIMVAPDGVYYVVYPQRKMGKSQFSMFHPIDKGVAAVIEKAIIDKFESITLPNQEWSYRKVRE